MTANPIDLVGGLTTTANVPKADFTAWAKARVPQVLTDVTELRNTTLAAQLVVTLKATGLAYLIDTADATTPDDGVSCIISSDGFRFKLAAVGGAVNFKRVSKTANYTVSTAEKGANIALSGNTYFTLTFNTASGFDASFAVIVTNEDQWGSGRAKWISLSGATSFYLWPDESVVIYNSNNTWRNLGHRRAKAPPATITLNSDNTLGTDTVGATDGLGTGAAAFKTATNAYVVGIGEFDFLAVSGNNLVIAMAPATTDTRSIHLPAPSMIGQAGNAGVTFKGATLALSNVANNGSGGIRVDVPSTATYTTGQVVSVYGVTGPTAANGTWKVTVINSTQLDLQGAAWPSIVWTGGGTITNGSVVSTTTLDAVGTFGPAHAIRFRDLTLQSTGLSGISIQGPGKLFLDDGVIFGPCGQAHITADGSGANIVAAAPYGVGGIAAGQLFHTFTAHGGQVIYQSPAGINVVPSVGPSQAFAIFAYALSQSCIDGANATTVNLNGNAITGVRWREENGGVVLPKTGVSPDAYFPGNSNGNRIGGRHSVVAAFAATASVTGTTAETTLVTIAVPPMRANDRLRITVQWGHVGTAGTWTVRTKFAGTSFGDIGAFSAGNPSARTQVEISNRNATNAQIGAAIGQANWSQSTTAGVTSAIDTSITQNITLTGQLASAADTVSVESYLVELLSP